MIAVAVVVWACAKEEKDTTDKGTPDVGLVDFIKKQKLADFQATTIGNAFESYRYLTKKEWKEPELVSGHYTVDFVGWFEPAALNSEDTRNGVTGKGLEIKFVVNPDGSFYVFMVSMLEAKSDGNVYRHQQTDGTGILANVYANKRISF
jgi:hypothetical protein